ncbi:MAG: helix-turn-helix domain-containing protein [Alphaproteobacteria bacterium]|jgi:excisionase family DNA binding protein|nr:helix-turn-helix domain-containing protein [Alphaproteobacteria bacterium]
MKEWNEHRLLSRKEAAEFLGVKEITLAIWQSTQRHKIPIVKVGRLVKYKFPDLLEFIERCTINQSTLEGKKVSDTSSDII